jgi:hypothetical protein
MRWPIRNVIREKWNKLFEMYFILLHLILCFFQFNCCGILSDADYINTKWRNESAGISNRSRINVPLTCCILANPDVSLCCVCVNVWWQHSLLCLCYMIFHNLCLNITVLFCLQMAWKFTSEHSNEQARWNLALTLMFTATSTVNYNIPQNFVITPIFMSVLGILVLLF